MDHLDALPLAAAEMRSRLLGIGPDQHFLPTPCGDWNVSGLLSHVLGGNRMAVRVLEGANRPEAVGYLAGLPIGDDPVATFDASVEEVRAAYSAPGALERVCEHPQGDLPGAMVLAFRVGDLTLHSWDLARAIGGDEQLPDELVQTVWDDMAPLEDNIVLSGVFGAGPSGEVGEDAPLQTRLLDLTGRRP